MANKPNSTNGGIPASNTIKISSRSSSTSSSTSISISSNSTSLTSPLSLPAIRAIASNWFELLYNGRTLAELNSILDRLNPGIPPGESLLDAAVRLMACYIVPDILIESLVNEYIPKSIGDYRRWKSKQAFSQTATLISEEEINIYLNREHPINFNFHSLASNLRDVPSLKSLIRKYFPAVSITTTDKRIDLVAKIITAQQYPSLSKADFISHLRSTKQEFQLWLTMQTPTPRSVATPIDEPSISWSSLYLSSVEELNNIYRTLYPQVPIPHIINDRKARLMLIRRYGLEQYLLFPNDKEKALLASSRAQYESYAAAMDTTSDTVQVPSKQAKAKATLPLAKQPPLVSVRQQAPLPTRQSVATKSSVPNRELQLKPLSLATKSRQTSLADSFKFSTQSTLDPNQLRLDFDSKTSNAVLDHGDLQQTEASPQLILSDLTVTSRSRVDTEDWITVKSGPSPSPPPKQSKQVRFHEPNGRYDSLLCDSSDDGLPDTSSEPDNASVNLYNCFWVNGEQHAVPTPEPIWSTDGQVHHFTFLATIQAIVSEVVLTTQRLPTLKSFNERLQCRESAQPLLDVTSYLVSLLDQQDPRIESIWETWAPADLYHCLALLSTIYPDVVAAWCPTTTLNLHPVQSTMADIPDISQRQCQDLISAMWSDTYTKRKNPLHRVLITINEDGGFSLQQVSLQYIAQFWTQENCPSSILPAIKSLPPPLSCSPAFPEVASATTTTAVTSTILTTSPPSNTVPRSFSIATVPPPMSIQKSDCLICREHMSDSVCSTILETLREAARDIFQSELIASEEDFRRRCLLPQLLQHLTGVEVGQSDISGFLRENGTQPCPTWRTQATCLWDCSENPLEWEASRRLSEGLWVTSTPTILQLHTLLHKTIVVDNELLPWSMLALFSKALNFHCACWEQSADKFIRMLEFGSKSAPIHFDFLIYDSSIKKLRQFKLKDSIVVNIEDWEIHDEDFQQMFHPGDTPICYLPSLMMTRVHALQTNIPEEVTIQITDKFNGADDDVVNVIGGFPIIRKDFRRLSSAAWLNDRIMEPICTIVHTLTRALTTRFTNFPKTYVVSHHFFNLVFGYDVHKREYTKSSLATALRHLKRVDIFSFDKLLFIENHDLHWTLFEVDFSKQSIGCLDHMSPQHRYAKEVDLLVQLLEDLSSIATPPDKKRNFHLWKRHHPYTLGVQMDGCSCGLFVLLDILFIILGLPPEYESSFLAMERFRMRLALWILMGRTTLFLNKEWTAPSPMLAVAMDDEKELRDYDWIENLSDEQIDVLIMEVVMKFNGAEITYLTDTATQSVKRYRMGTLARMADRAVVEQLTARRKLLQSPLDSSQHKSIREWICSTQTSFSWDLLRCLSTDKFGSFSGLMARTALFIPHSLEQIQEITPGVLLSNESLDALALEISVYTDLQNAVLPPDWLSTSVPLPLLAKWEETTGWTHLKQTWSSPGCSVNLRVPVTRRKEEVFENLLDIQSKVNDYAIVAVRNGREIVLHMPITGLFPSLIEEHYDFNALTDWWLSNTPRDIQVTGLLTYDLRFFDSLFFCWLATRHTPWTTVTALEVTHLQFLHAVLPKLKDHNDFAQVSQTIHTLITQIGCIENTTEAYTLWSTWDIPEIKWRACIETLFPLCTISMSQSSDELQMRIPNSTTYVGIITQDQNHLRLVQLYDIGADLEQMSLAVAGCVALRILTNMSLDEAILKVDQNKRWKWVTSYQSTLPLTRVEALMAKSKSGPINLLLGLGPPLELLHFDSTDPLPVLLPGDSINPQVRDAYRVKLLMETATVFTWNRQANLTPFHIDGEFSRSTLETAKKNKHPTLMLLLDMASVGRHVEYVALDPIHTPCIYTSQLVPGVIDAINWLTQHKIITTATVIEIKNLKQEHAGEGYLRRLEKGFTIESISMLDSKIAQLSIEFYSWLSKMNYKNRGIQEQFKDAVKTKEMLRMRIRSSDKPIFIPRGKSTNITENKISGNGQHRFSTPTHPSQAPVESLHINVLLKETEILRRTRSCVIVKPNTRNTQHQTYVFAQEDHSEEKISTCTSFGQLCAQLFEKIPINSVCPLRRREEDVATSVFIELLQQQFQGDLGKVPDLTNSLCQLLDTIPTSSTTEKVRMVTVLTSRTWEAGEDTDILTFMDELFPLSNVVEDDVIWRERSNILCRLSEMLFLLRHPERKQTSIPLFVPCMRLSVTDIRMFEDIPAGYLNDTMEVYLSIVGCCEGVMSLELHMLPSILQTHLEIGKREMVHALAECAITGLPLQHTQIDWFDTDKDLRVVWSTSPACTPPVNVKLHKSLLTTQRKRKPPPSDTTSRKKSEVKLPQPTLREGRPKLLQTTLPVKRTFREAISPPRLQQMVANLQVDHVTRLMWSLEGEFSRVLIAGFHSSCEKSFVAEQTLILLTLCKLPHDPQAVTSAIQTQQCTEYMSNQVFWTVPLSTPTHFSTVNGETFYTSSMLSPPSTIQIKKQNDATTVVCFFLTLSPIPTWYEPTKQQFIVRGFSGYDPMDCRLIADLVWFLRRRLPTSIGNICAVRLPVHSSIPLYESEDVQHKAILRRKFTKEVIVSISIETGLSPHVWTWMVSSNALKKSPFRGTKGGTQHSGQFIQISSFGSHFDIWESVSMLMSANFQNIIPSMKVSGLRPTTRVFGRRDDIPATLTLEHTIAKWATDDALDLSRIAHVVWLPSTLERQKMFPVFRERSMILITWDEDVQLCPQLQDCPYNVAVETSDCLPGFWKRGLGDRHAFLNFHLGTVRRICVQGELLRLGDVDEPIVLTLRKSNTCVELVRADWGGKEETNSVTSMPPFILMDKQEEHQDQSDLTELSPVVSTSSSITATTLETMVSTATMELHKLVEQLRIETEKNLAQFREQTESNISAIKLQVDEIRPSLDILEHRIEQSDKHLLKVQTDMLTKDDVKSLLDDTFQRYFRQLIPPATVPQLASIEYPSALSSSHSSTAMTSIVPSQPTTSFNDK